MAVNMMSDLLLYHYIDGDILFCNENRFYHIVDWKECIEWCDENIKLSWLAKPMDHEEIWEFGDETDAMAFKLRWC